MEMNRTTGTGSLGAGVLAAGEVHVQRCEEWVA
jgi:hypothetical protein